MHAAPNRAMASLVRFVLAHRTMVAVAWLALVLVAGVLAARLPQIVQGGADPIPGSETGRVIRGMDRAFGRGAYYATPIVIEHAGRIAADPEVARGVGAIASALAASPHVRTVHHYWNTGSVAMLGRDGHTSVLVVTPDVATYSEAEALTASLRDTLRRATPPAFRTYVTGTTAMLYDLDQKASSDLLAAERIGLPITLLILLVVFQAPLAALLPIVIAIAAVLLCEAALVLLSPLMPVSVFAENTASMIGLGVGVDYALFILSRFRSERRRGLVPAEAARVAVSEVGGPVLFSAATVAVGFLALFLVDAPFLRAVALGGVSVVVAAGLASVTLLPVLLSAFGPAIDWPRRPGPGTSAPREGAWAKWAHTVMRHPWPALLVAGAIVVGLAWPALSMRGWNVDAHSLPAEAESRLGYERLRSQLSVGWMGPLVVLAEARSGDSVWRTEPRRALAAIGDRLAHEPRIEHVLGFPALAAAADALPFEVRGPGDLPPPLRAASAGIVSDDGRSAMLAVLPALDPPTREASALVRDLRRHGWPEADRAGLSVGLAGPAAGFVDFDDELFGRLPLVVGVVLALTFVVLLVSFRSIVIPLKAIALNLLSVLAAYGFLVVVFQHGIGSSLLRLDPPGGINSFIVLMLFTILFGLSMDYEVFLLSRIREAYDRTGDTRAAVAEGLEHTAGIITSAALIMISIFAAFGFTHLTATREFGLGLAFAVALDATLVRVVLVPALMVLAGRANWWLPARLAAVIRGRGGAPPAPRSPGPAANRR